MTMNKIFKTQQLVIFVESSNYLAEDKRVRDLKNNGLFMPQCAVLLTPCLKSNNI